MDLGLDAEMPAAGAPARKARAVGNSKKEEEQRMTELLNVVVKCCLSSAMQVRAMRAITITCIRVAAQSVWVKGHKDATTAYATKAKELQDLGKSGDFVKDQIGIPSVHGFNAWVKIYMQGLERDKKEGELEVMKRAVGMWNTQGGWTYIAKYVRHCRVAKMWEGSQKRIEVSVPGEFLGESVDVANTAQLTPNWAWLKIKAAILGDPGAKELMGMAPRGDLERRLQEYLDEQGAASTK